MPRRKIKRKPRKKKRLTKAMRRKRLEKATAAYFASLSGEALREENELGRALAYEASLINYQEDS